MQVLRCRYVYNIIGEPVLMNHYFSMVFGGDEICVIKHLPMGFEFYPQKLGECHFLLETDLKSMAFMRPYTIPLSPMRLTKKKWAPIKTDTPILQGSEMILSTNPRWTLNILLRYIINKQTDQLLSEHTATLDVQVSESEVLRLYVDDILLDKEESKSS